MLMQHRLQPNMPVTFTSACSPPSATLLGALTRSEELITIPGLTPTLIKNHLPRSTATDKGHMRRHRSNTASTRNNHSDIVAARAEVDHMFPQHEICTMKDVFCFAALANTITGTMYTDITGAFPVCSFKSMQYIFVAYVYDLNAIIVRAMPSRTDASMVTAFTEVITTLKTGGYCPALNVMDNECSAAVEKYIRSEQINIQLIPPHNHQVNAAERAIATFKEHFIAALATVDMHCPLKLRDEFLPQVELTLNMLHFSRRNHNRSANQEVYGSIDFNKTPIHELHTNHNNPFNILTDDDNDDDTVVASNCSPYIPPPFLPTSDLPIRQPTNRPTRQLAIQPKSLPSPRQPSNPPTSPPPRKCQHAPSSNPTHFPLLNRTTTEMRCPRREHPQGHDAPPDSSLIKLLAIFPAKPCTMSLALVS